VSYTLGINHLADYTEEEYTAMLGFKKPDTYTAKYNILDTESIPASIDWRTKGAVNAVKD